MSTPPVEPPNWGDDQNPDDVARSLREQIAAAKRRMQDYRDEMEASGLTQSRGEDEADPARAAEPQS